MKKYRLKIDLNWSSHKHKKGDVLIKSEDTENYRYEGTENYEPLEFIGNNPDIFEEIKQIEIKGIIVKEFDYHGDDFFEIKLTEPRKHKLLTKPCKIIIEE